MTIVKLQMFQNYFNEADEEKKGGVTRTQFLQAVRDTITEHVTAEHSDMVFKKVDTYDTGIVTWEVRSAHLSLSLWTLPGASNPPLWAGDQSPPHLTR